MGGCKIRKPCKNDTLKISVVAIDTNKLIIANRDLNQNYNNLIGTIFYNNVNYQSSEVVSVNQNIITLKENIFDIFFDNITTVNDIYNMYDVITDGFFINKSKHNTNNLQILGTKSIVNNLSETTSSILSPLGIDFDSILGRLW